MIHHAAEISGKKTKHHTDHCGNQRRQHAYQKGNPGRIQKTAQHVTSDLIGSQPVLRARRAGKGTHNGIRVVGSDHRRQKRGSHNDDQNHKAHRRQMVSAEPAEYGLKIAFI